MRASGEPGHPIPIAHAGTSPWRSEPGGWKIHRSTWYGHPPTVEPAGRQTTFEEGP